MLIRYIIKRLLIAIPTLLVISLLVFMVIQLPPGSYIDTRKEQMQQTGEFNQAELDSLRNDYHIEEPMLVRYGYWMVGLLQGDLGKSFEDDADVTAILADTLPLTIVISIFTILLTWAIAIPFGIIAAVKKNTVWDYALTFIGLTAMATPAFVIALIFQEVLQTWFPGFNPSGLVSGRYVGEDLSVAKAGDFMLHLLVPVLILGVAGTAGMIRVLRANVIDELRKMYVLASRARGLHPAMVVLRYPVRVAINPMVSNIGLILPRIISGSVIVAQVLGLQTVGPKLLIALKSQDTYLASSIVFIQCVLAVVGILISDILLSMVDPRIKFSSR